MNRSKKIIHAGLIVISLVYTVVLLKIVLLKSGIHSSEFRHVQYIPFAFIKLHLHNHLLQTNILAALILLQNK